MKYSAIMTEEQLVLQGFEQIPLCAGMDYYYAKEEGPKAWIYRRKFGKEFELHAQVTLDEHFGGIW